MKNLLGDGIFTVDGEQCRAFDDANTLTYKRFADISLKIKKFFNIGFEAELKKNMRVIDEFVYKVIRIKIEQMQKSKDELLFESIIKTCSSRKKTSYQVQDKVAKEIIDATNIKEEITDVADFAARASEGTLDEKMQYLHAALTETIRLYPALAVDMKICFADDVLPDGYNVKKGDTVAYQPYAMGRMKFIWGDDAHEFKLERWLDQDGCFHQESPFNKEYADNICALYTLVMKQVTTGILQSELQLLLTHGFGVLKGKSGQSC
ncbi:hypothetical protein L1987_03319 [Smallanthus sonchifolius]|uniref:Uncharacterized protein n=1 Tax=Smallanthus sonchifolius TaxID=185202 RepID=A0ACB9KA83_9ASTR|nr:hypothetical protein L1987_03319 [Smallanthus sonchifolius]